MRKQLIEKAYEMGVAGFAKYHSAPCMNPEFMAIVPNCSFGDDKGVKLRVAMYKAYSKGWTQEHVKSMVI
jgi:hypothetical protein